MKHALMILLATAMVACGQVQYAFTNFAGVPGGSGSADGTGSAARFNSPSGVAADSAGNVYVADQNNHTIRKITPDGVVTTLAGSAGQHGSANGTGSAARFAGPYGVAVDSTGNVYVADTGNHTIRKITPDGVVTTLAGLAQDTNGDGYNDGGYADGTGSDALFNGPSGVAVDSVGNVYVADRYNFTIRKITPGGVVTTLAGSAGEADSRNGIGSAARFGDPSGVAVDSAGNVYVADDGGFPITIRKITPAGVVTTFASSAVIAGIPNSGLIGGLAVDSAGNVYVSDLYNYGRIRKITPAGTATTLAGGQEGDADGTGSAARFRGGEGLAVDSAGNVYVADSGNHTIRKITTGRVVTTLAGSAGYGSANGIGSAARFNGPHLIAEDSIGNVYVADTYNDTIRKITPDGVVTTLAGSAGQYGSANGTGSAARFNWPGAVAEDSAGNVYVADTSNHTIRKITPTGAVTTFAGSPGQAGSDDGTGSAALFNRPSGVAVDTGGNVYVADTSNHTIRKITPDGEVTTLAGLVQDTNGDGYNDGGYADGTGSAALFNRPSGLAVDSGGNVYVADTSNHTIRKITPDGDVTSLAGLAQDTNGDGYNDGGYADGTGSAALFNRPSGVAVDSGGYVYVADTSNHTIRKITPAGDVTTLAGSAGQQGDADGIGSAARFGAPFGVAVDSAGNLYVTDHDRITKGTPIYFQFHTSAGSLAVSNSLFQTHLTGPSGSNVVVEASVNLQAWTPIQTNVLPPEGLDLSVPLGRTQNQFLRARLAP